MSKKMIAILAIAWSGLTLMGIILAVGTAVRPSWWTVVCPTCACAWMYWDKFFNEK